MRNALGIMQRNGNCVTSSLCRVFVVSSVYVSWWVVFAITEHDSDATSQPSTQVLHDDYRRVRSVFLLSSLFRSVHFTGSVKLWTNVRQDTCNQLRLVMMLSWYRTFGTFSCNVSCFCNRIFIILINNSLRSSAS